MACFVLIALPVSFACWVYATRKVYRRPPVVSIFLSVVFVGVVVGWFSAPPYSLLPATFVLTAMLAGLAGGWMQVKWVKIKKVESTEPVAPLVLGELFQWDRRAFAITLAVVVVALVIVALGLFGQPTRGREADERELIILALAGTFWSALVMPFFVVAMRGTTGKSREFFQSMLTWAIFAGYGPFAGMALLSDDKLTLPLILRCLVVILVGLAAGCALVYFGKVRPKAR